MFNFPRRPALTRAGIGAVLVALVTSAVTPGAAVLAVCARAAPTGSGCPGPGPSAQTDTRRPASPDTNHPGSDGRGRTGRPHR